jgi:phosphoribosyl 1,2-cyclic phosphodiesterase
MLLEVHGARGSAPESGPAFDRYGGHTTCFEIALPDGERLLIDAGTGLASVAASLARDDARAPFVATVLLTHFHWDHIQGLPFFPPLFEASTRLRFIATPPPGMTIAEALGAVIRPPWFPVRLDEVAAQLSFEALGSEPLRIGPLEVTSAPLAHPGGSSGYRIKHAGRALVIATDVEAADATSQAAVRAIADGAAVLIHDAQYRPAEYLERRTGWGHSTWEQAARIAAAAGVARLVLTSHDQGRSDAAVDAIVDEARAIFPATAAAHEGMQIEF